jgi:putative aldouronate transport system substrate-binding protein
MKSTKRILILLTAIAMLLSLAAGCTQSSVTESKQTTASTQTQATTTTSASTTQKEEPSTQLPIVDKPITLTFFAPMHNSVASVAKTYGDVECWKEFEKLTNIKIDWINPIEGVAEQLSLMVASGDLPDLVNYNWAGYQGGKSGALEDGVAIKLNEYLDDYAPNISKQFNINPDMKKVAMLDDGTLNVFPLLQYKDWYKGEIGWFNSWGLLIRKDWLDTLDLNVPTTIDEYYNVMKAFKENDVNKNGDPNDEIPLITSDRTIALDFFASSWGIMSDFYMDGDEVKYGPIQPIYKEYLVEMNKWYTEGLLHSEYLTTDRAKYEPLIISSIGGSFPDWLTFQGRFMDNGIREVPEFELVGVPWLIGPAGKSYAGTNNYDAQYSRTHGTSITSKNNHVIESVKWLDFAYSDQGVALLNFGIENVSYVIEDNKFKFTDAVMKEPSGLSPDVALSKYSTQLTNLHFIKVADANKQFAYRYQQQLDAAETWITDLSLLVPNNISFTPDETAVNATIMSQIQTYKSEMFHRMVTGVEPLSSFENFVSEIERLGIEEAIDIRQAAYDRFKGRK